MPFTTIKTNQLLFFITIMNYSAIIVSRDFSYLKSYYYIIYIVCTSIIPWVSCTLDVKCIQK